MAERRMFAKTIIDSDAFLDMPLSSQALYFHLAMRADDEGFINNPRKIMRMIGCSDDDMRILIGKRYVLVFESGVLVIKHWKIHNYIRGDRLIKTKYEEEREQLAVKPNGSYTLNGSTMSVTCQSDVSQMSDTCQSSDRQLVDTGKDSIGKYSIDNKYIVESEPKEEEKEPSSDERKRSYASDITAVIDYLNLRTGRSFRKESKSTQKHIIARLKEGYTVNQLCEVIDKKCREWLNDPQLSQYLRPETLFGSKFESYLNAPVSYRKRDTVDTPAYFEKWKNGEFEKETEEADPDLLAKIKEQQERMKS